MVRRTSVRLPAAVIVAAVLALTGCSAAQTARNPGGPVIGTSPAGIPDPSAAASGPGPVDTGSGCGPDQVRAEVTELEPSASNRSLLLSLVNRTAADCAVTNPPILELVGADGSSRPAVIEPGALAAGRVPVDVIPAEFGVTVEVAWRVVPGGPGADPAVDCVSAEALRVRLTADAPPIDAPVNITACDGGSLLVSPYDIDAG